MKHGWHSKVDAMFQMKQIVENEKQLKSHLTMLQGKQNYMIFLFRNTQNYGKTIFKNIVRSTHSQASIYRVRGLRKMRKEEPKVGLMKSVMSG